MKVEKCPLCDRVELFNATWTRYQYQCDCHEEHGNILFLLKIKWNRWVRLTYRGIFHPCGQCRWAIDRNDGLSILCNCRMSYRYNLATHAKRMSCWCWARREAKRIKEGNGK